MTTARLLGKRGLGAATRLVRFVRRVPRRWVLTFHEVGDHPWATTPERFEGLLRAVLERAAVTSLQDLVSRPDGDGPRVALAFDDGYLGVVERALPVLERLGMPATVFLPTDLLREEDAVPRPDRGLYDGLPLLGWRSVRRLAGRGPLGFESHGAAHVSLPTLAAGARLEDLRRSVCAIEAATGVRPSLLAYPFGAADAPSASAAREVGFVGAFTTRHGGLCPEADPFLLPRVDVRSDYEPRDVLAILEGDWDYLAWVQAARGARG